jgi:hypothetical protein
MNSFMLGYFGGSRPNSEEEGRAHMLKWQSWVEGLGDSIVNPGTPLMASKLVTLNGIEEDTNSNAMKGFAVIKAESMDAALEISKTDPFLEIGGTIRVSQLMEMPSK